MAGGHAGALPVLQRFEARMDNANDAAGLTGLPALRTTATRWLRRENRTMNTLQELFDRLLGIAHYQAAQRHKAHQVFCTPTLDLIPLEKPACWRRPARIQRSRHS